MIDLTSPALLTILTALAALVGSGVTAYLSIRGFQATQRKDQETFQVSLREEMRKEIDRLSDRAQALTAERDSLSDANVALRRTVGDRDGAIEEFKRKVVSLEDRVTQLTARVKELEVGHP